ncbi:MAG TPA: DUF4296 domain-containing protein [Ignavibacteriaceae bacterium]|nr:DUF4296 domain-containing protein [Ignavibacteriaceae bacterium]
MKNRNNFRFYFILLCNYCSLSRLHYSGFSILFFGFFVLSSLNLVSCSDKNIDHEKFVDTYIDLRISEDTLKPGSGNIQDLKKEILKKHGLTEEQYEKTFNYLNENPERWNNFYDEIIARVDTLRKTGKK